MRRLRIEAMPEIFNTGEGSQFAVEAFTAVLKAPGGRVALSYRVNPRFIHLWPEGSLSKQPEPPLPSLWISPSQDTFGRSIETRREEVSRHEHQVK